MGEMHPVSQLQECMARRNKPLPIYTVQLASSSMGNRFVCTVQVGGITTVGHGSSKQNAKHDAAKEALNQLRYSNNNNCDNLISLDGLSTYSTCNYIGLLNELMAKNGLTYPGYVECGVNNLKEFIIKCTALHHTTEGIATTKKQAKQYAAQEMLKLLRPIVETAVPQCMSKNLNFLEDDVIIEKYKNIKLKREVEMTVPVNKLPQSGSSSLLSVSSAQKQFDDESNVLTKENDGDKRNNYMAAVLHNNSSKDNLLDEYTLRVTQTLRLMGKEQEIFAKDLIERILVLGLSNQLSHSSSIVSTSTDFVDNNVKTADEMWQELSNITKNIKVETIQEHPKYVLSLHLIDSDKNIFEVGDTYSEAFHNLLNRSLMIVKEIITT